MTEPYVCEFCLEEPNACDCDRTEGGGHWVFQRRATAMHSALKPNLLLQKLLVELECRQAEWLKAGDDERDAAQYRFMSAMWLLHGPDGIMADAQPKCVRRPPRRAESTISKIRYRPKLA
jgi:hypothetical protein